MSSHPTANGGPDDIERGNSIGAERGKSIVSLSGFQGMDEYTALQRYIVSYRDPKENPKEEEAIDVKNPWWAFWRASHTNKSHTTPAGAETPEEWLNTTISQGLTSAEVENRRKRVGFNELASEKENMLKKFLGFFNGPVLWGETEPRPIGNIANRCQLWNLLLYWPQVLAIGSISVSSAVSCSSTQSLDGTKKSKLPTLWLACEVTLR
jgi:magnesium-transporting ATPase (P-type)